jgi:hypothetical protein
MAWYIYDWYTLWCDVAMEIYLPIPGTKKKRDDYPNGLDSHPSDEGNAPCYVLHAT